MKSLHHILALLVAGMCFAANAAEDDFLLYWQVDDPVIDVFGNGLKGEKTGETSIAQLIGETGKEDWVVKVGVYTKSGDYVNYVNLWHSDDPFRWTDPVIDHIAIDSEDYDAGPSYANIGNYVTLKEGGNKNVATDWTSGEYVFALELGYWENDSFTQMAKSEEWSYEDFISNSPEGHSYIKSTQLQLPDTMEWTGGRYVETPEPTSGMLVLFGLSFLALRRKQQEKGAA